MLNRKRLCKQEYMELVQAIRVSLNESYFSFVVELD